MQKSAYGQMPTSFIKEYNSMIGTDNKPKDMILVPCSHHISKHVAEQLFGSSLCWEDGWKLGKNWLCNTCQKPVVGCIKDVEFVTEKVANASLPPLPTNHNNSVMMGFMNLARSQIQNAPIVPNQYPGKISHFKLMDEPGRIGEKSWAMNFMSNEGEFIENIEIQWSERGRLSMWIIFDKSKSSDFVEFLQKHGVPILMGGKEMEQGAYLTKNENEFKALYNIILKHNVFDSEDDKMKLEGLVKKHLTQ